MVRKQSLHVLFLPEQGWSDCGEASQATTAAVVCQASAITTRKRAGTKLRDRVNEEPDADRVVSDIAEGRVQCESDEAALIDVRVEEFERYVAARLDTSENSTQSRI